MQGLVLPHQKKMPPPWGSTGARGRGVSGPKTRTWCCRTKKAPSLGSTGVWGAALAGPETAPVGALPPTTQPLVLPHQKEKPYFPARVLAMPKS